MQEKPKFWIQNLNYPSEWREVCIHSEGTCRFTKMNGNVDRNLSPGFTVLLYQPDPWTLFRHAIVQPLVLADLLEGKVLTISWVNSCMFSLQLLLADLKLDLKITVWLANYTVAKQHHKYDDYLPEKWVSCQLDQSKIEQNSRVL